MSAWPVSDAEIDCLVWWIKNLGMSKRDNDSIGRELRSQNYRSLRARYGWYVEDYRKAPAYHYNLPVAGSRHGQNYDPYNEDQALKMVHFYDYQSCEHGERYHKSQAYRWMQRLEAILEEQGANWQREGLTWGAA